MLTRDEGLAHEGDRRLERHLLQRRRRRVHRSWTEDEGLRYQSIFRQLPFTPYLCWRAQSLPWMSCGLRWGRDAASRPRYRTPRTRRSFPARNIDWFFCFTVNLSRFFPSNLRSSSVRDLCVTNLFLVVVFRIPLSSSLPYCNSHKSPPSTAPTHCCLLELSANSEN